MNRSTTTSIQTLANRTRTGDIRTVAGIYTTVLLAPKRTRRFGRHLDANRGR